MAIFNSYVKLPEGIFPIVHRFAMVFSSFLGAGKSTGSMGCQGLRHAAGGKPMERVGMLSCYDYDISWCIYVYLFMER